MKLVSAISGFFILLSLFLLMPSGALGAGADLVFNMAEAPEALSFENVNEAHIRDRGLLLEGKGYVKIGPKGGLRAPLRRLAVELHFTTAQSLIIDIRVRSTHGWEGSKTLRVNAQRGEGKERVVRLYLGDTGVDDVTGEAENYIDNFIVAFSGAENIGVILHSLRFYEPTAFGRAALYWQEFWRPDFITGTTVGYVPTPVAGGVGFISILYIFIGLAFIFTLLLSLARGNGIVPRKAAKNLIIISLLAGALFALRMDYNWLTIWRDDIKTLSGVDVDKRIRLVNYNAYDKVFDFVDFIKRTVPPGRTVRPATMKNNTSLAAIMRYYMLPIEDSVDAGLLWSYGEVLRLDPWSGSLYDADGRLIAARARLFARYTDTAAIYEVIK